MSQPVRNRSGTKIVVFDKTNIKEVVIISIFIIFKFLGNNIYFKKNNTFTFVKEPVNSDIEVI